MGCMVMDPKLNTSTMNGNPLHYEKKTNFFLHVVSDVWHNNDNVMINRIFTTILGVQQEDQGIGRVYTMPKGT